MLKFRTMMSVPPGGRYWYDVKETDTRFEHAVFDNLVYEVRDHYMVNNIECPENLREIIQDRMCMELPGDFCKGELEPGADLRVKRMNSLTTQKIRDFTHVLANKASRWISGTPFYVTQKEAERRASICMNCPENAIGRWCTTCSGLKQLKFLIAHGKTTPYDSRLGVCMICGCLLESKIHVVKEALAGSYTMEYPDNCWLKE